MATRKKKRLNEGLVLAHVTPEKSSGCLVELRFTREETARSGELAEFARDICAQILERAPRYVSREQVPWEEVRREERGHRSEAEKVYARSDTIDEYLKEKMNEWYQQVCLMEQPFYKDPTILVGERWVTAKTNLGDELEIARFACYSVENGK